MRKCYSSKQRITLANKRGIIVIGLHVSVSSDGKIKRHLSTANGEVPLADVIIFDELVALIEGEVWLICAFVKSVLLETDVASDCKAGAGAGRP